MENDFAEIETKERKRETEKGKMWPHCDGAMYEILVGQFCIRYLPRVVTSYTRI